MDIPFTTSIPRTSSTFVITDSFFHGYIFLYLVSCICTRGFSKKIVRNIG